MHTNHTAKDLVELAQKLNQLMSAGNLHWYHMAILGLAMVLGVVDSMGLGDKLAVLLLSYLSRKPAGCTTVGVEWEVDRGFDNPSYLVLDWLLERHLGVS
jgi:hypothetical protein